MRTEIVHQLLRATPRQGGGARPPPWGHPFASVRSMKYVVWYAVVAERAPDLPLVNHGTRHIWIR